MSVARDALEAVDFWLGGELQIQPQVWHREISFFSDFSTEASIFFPDPSTEASIFLAYESLHRCSSGMHLMKFWTDLLVFIS